MMRRLQHGSALVVALFVVTIVAALGVVALRLGATQTHTASLELDGYRAELAANAGIEAFSNRVANRNPVAAAPACPGTPVNINIGNSAGNGNFSVVMLTCTRIVSGTIPDEHAVYEIAVQAQRGAFGQPNFVRRTATRRIATFGGLPAPLAGTY